MGKNVITIPVKAKPHITDTTDRFYRRKVAGYARVSTNHEEQETSFDAQMDYYKNYITGRPDWKFVGMYSDEGISATSTAHREGFNKMVEDALDGKIDLIITKSVSRFDRNTVDSLSTIRKLKEHQIEVYFEKENIWTFDAKGELLITIMSSLAQEESRSISENVTWGQRKRFADGKGSVAYSHFLGYDKGPDGKLAVNPEQAEIVRQIYKWFLEGMTGYSIAKKLTEMGIKTPAGKEKWHPTTVDRILQNEKYKGDLLLQKGYTTDFLTKKRKKNNGEIQQYYVEGDHEAIIDPATFDMVQAEFERRLNEESRYSGIGVFSSKIKCGCCGAWFGAKVWHSTNKYRKIIYRCNRKYANDEKCTSGSITEEEIESAFVAAANKLLGNKGEVIANIDSIKKDFCETGELEKQLAACDAEIAKLTVLMQKCIDKNARKAQGQDEYIQQFSELEEQYDLKSAEHDRLKEEIKQKKGKATAIDEFTACLKKQEGLIDKFDIDLWSSLVDYATVYAPENIVFIFVNGAEIKA